MEDSNTAGLRWDADLHVSGTSGSNPLCSSGESAAISVIGSAFGADNHDPLTLTRDRGFKSGFLRIDREHYLVITIRKI
jgi:hypothetical protein